MIRELRFLLSLWKVNLLAAMEYRVAFLSQAIGMVLNNAVLFLFWVIFFDRFKEVRGWGLDEMFLLHGVVAASYGLGVYLFGNILTLTEVISRGNLDYYLSLPRPVLLHVLASRSIPSGAGDAVYGLGMFLISGQANPSGMLRFLLGVILSMMVFLGFMILVQSIVFWVGNAQMISGQAINAVLTFSLYPITLFDGSARLILYTVIPAAFMGALPVEFIRGFTWPLLLQLIGAAALFLGGSVWIFLRGLRHYESGSAIQVQM